MAFWYGAATGRRTDLVRDRTTGYGNPHLGGTGARTLWYGYRTSTVRARTIGTGRYGSRTCSVQVLHLACPRGHKRGGGAGVGAGTHAANAHA